MKFSRLFLAAGLLPVSAIAQDHFLSDSRQLTFSGRRSGEGYFSADGKKLIFQSEREPDNPFYQIYLLDFDTGDINRVSPGTGKTTCAWLFPDSQRVLFASTHEDAAAVDKQKAELSDRAAGTQKRYAWDYDENYDIFSAKTDGTGLTNLTKTRGYDAEGSCSPDGKWIAFTSNRSAWTDPLTKEQQERFERQPSWANEIWIMQSDGTELRRLTNTPGYDGGPFFSADGQKICWRRFNEEEDKAEIWTMNTDGSDARQLTHMGAMSWAPYFHPSGKYLVFTTNRHGFDNFELYLVDAAGTHEPVRVTETAGFDGLPVFSPDGTRLAWTSNRTSDKASQIFIGQWDHAAALSALGITDRSPGAPVPAGPDIVPAAAFAADISPADLRHHVEYLASDELMGRMTGTAGERMAIDYAAKRFAEDGLLPAGDDGTFFHAFTYTAGVDLGPANSLTVSPAGAAVTVEQDWIPLSLSSTGESGSGGIVFAGYGLEVPAGRDDNGAAVDAYSSYFHLEVKDKWVMVLRYLPEGISQDERVRFARYSSLRYKALTARDKGARGIIVVSGPTSKVVQQLIPLGWDASMSGSGLSAISVTDALADRLLQKAGKSLQALQESLDKGSQDQGFDIPEVTLSARIDLRQEKRTGHNVIARLPAPSPAVPGKPAVIIGAHIDHLGMTGGSNSRATGDALNEVHHGADDNASGVASLLELAQYFSAGVRAGTFKPERDILFAAWSGEEIGLLGSNAWCRDLAKKSGDENAKLHGQLSANLNMDMVGRLRKNLVLQGLGSSPWWAGEIEKRNAVTGLAIQTQQDCYLPTDAATFYLRGVPILSAFTGQHEDYHKPSDTADKINYDGAARITRFMGLVARSLATSPDEPVWQEQKSPNDGGRGGLRVYLGTVPDYSQDGIDGVKLSGVAAVGPAAKAGVQTGDIIVKLAGKDIKNIYDYTFVMGALKIGQETEMTVLRGTEKVSLKVTPGSRE